jgi:hypothetical protein
VREWRAVSGERTRSSLPPTADGALRLYRFERDAAEVHRNALFATDRAIAESYARPGVSGRLVYVDVPAERIRELRPSHSQPDRLFVAPRSISMMSRAIDSSTEATVVSFRARAEAALGEAERSTPSHLKETRPMRTVETMTASRARMAEIIRRMQAALPGDEARQEFTQAQRLLETTDSVIAEQARLDRHRSEVQGDRYVRPEPAKDLADIFTHQRKGDEIHYRRHDATGAYQTLAFIDRGKDIDVRDRNNAASINAALALAAQKWETVSVNGTDEYKEKAARLAAEHGYKISNPELQDRIRELRAEIEAERARHAESESRGGSRTEATGNAQADRSAEYTTAEPRVAVKSGESELVDRAARAEMAEARLLSREIASYKDDIASTKDERYRELSIKRLAEAEARLEAFLSKPVERSAESEAPESRVTATSAEQEFRLQDIRGRIEREADRESRQAERAQAAHETNAAQGTERTPYRSVNQAESARRAERSIDNDAHRPVPPDARQSEEMANLTRQQRRLLEQEIEQRRVDAENAERANREYQRSRHAESEGEEE